MSGQALPPQENSLNDDGYHCKDSQGTKFDHCPCGEDVVDAVDGR